MVADRLTQPKPATAITANLRPKPLARGRRLGAVEHVDLNFASRQESSGGSWGSVDLAVDNLDSAPTRFQ